MRAFAQRRALLFAEYVRGPHFTPPATAAAAAADVAGPSAGKTPEQRALDTVFYYVKENDGALKYLAHRLLVEAPDSWQQFLVSDEQGRRIATDSTAVYIAARIQQRLDATLGLAVKEHIGLSWDRYSLLRKTLFMEFGSEEDKWKAFEIAPGVNLPTLPGRFAVYSLRDKVLSAAGLTVDADGTASIDVETRIRQELEEVRLQQLLAGGDEQEWRLLIGGDGQPLFHGFGCTALVMKLAAPDQKFTQSAQMLDTLLVYQGHDKHEALKAKAAVLFPQIEKLMKEGLRFEIEIDGSEGAPPTTRVVKVTFRLYLSGDVPFMCALLGISGPSAIYFCIECECCHESLAEGHIAERRCFVRQLQLSHTYNADAMTDAATGEFTPFPCPGCKVRFETAEQLQRCAAPACKAAEEAYAKQHFSTKFGRTPLIPGWLSACTLISWHFIFDVLHCALRAYERLFGKTISQYITSKELQDQLITALEAINIQTNKRIPMAKTTVGSAADVSQPTFIGRHVTVLRDQGKGQELVMAFTPARAQAHALRAWDAHQQYWQHVHSGPDVHETPANRAMFLQQMERHAEAVKGAITAVGGAKMAAIGHAMHDREHIAEAVRIHGCDLMQYSCQDGEAKNFQRKKTVRCFSNYHKKGPKNVLMQAMAAEISQRHVSDTMMGLRVDASNRAEESARGRAAGRQPLADIQGKGLEVAPGAHEEPAAKPGRKRKVAGQDP